MNIIPLQLKLCRSLSRQPDDKMCRFDLSFVHLVCHGYVLLMFPPSWHISLKGRIHYALLFADHMDRIQAETIHPLLGWLDDKQFHSHGDSPASSLLLQYFHSFIFSYRIQLQPWNHCSLAIDVMQNALKHSSWKRSIPAMKSDKFQIKEECKD